MRYDSLFKQRYMRQGVSIVEITVTVMILGILAAIASPIYSRSLVNYRVDVATQRIIQDIEQTKQVARQKNSSQMIAFSTSDHGYKISGVQSLDKAGQTYLVSLGNAPYQCQLLSLAKVDEPTVAITNLDVTFDRFGMPNYGILLRVGTGTIQRQIFVAPISGRVSVQEVNALQASVQ